MYHFAKSTMGWSKFKNTNITKTNREVRSKTRLGIQSRREYKPNSRRKGATMYSGRMSIQSEHAWSIPPCDKIMMTHIELLPKTPMFRFHIYTFHDTRNDWTFEVIVLWCKRQEMLAIESVVSDRILYLLLNIKRNVVLVAGTRDSTFLTLYFGILYRYWQILDHITSSLYYV